MLPGDSLSPDLDDSNRLILAAMPSEKARVSVQVAPGAGREYAMGPVRAVFKADGEETRGQYSISEWWLEPYTRGPTVHQHDEDDVNFVIEGTISFFIGDEWIEAPKGSLVIAPGGTPHSFENRTAERAGMLNISVPGDFEPDMVGIAEWFRARPADEARTANAPRSESR
jgi:mannose-6-phosphate isomerase-like protein (cupin superfamily)